MGDWENPAIVPGTSVAVDGRAVLIIGPSGSGKSALALDMMSRGALLIADDRTVLTATECGIVASAPKEIAGMIEARGVGLVRVNRTTEAALDLVADLERAPSGRLPERESADYMGRAVEVIRCKGVGGLAAALMLGLASGNRFDFSDS